MVSESGSSGELISSNESSGVLTDWPGLGVDSLWEDFSTNWNQVATFWSLQEAGGTLTPTESPTGAPTANGTAVATAFVPNVWDAVQLETLFSDGREVGRLLGLAGYSSPYTAYKGRATGYARPQL